MKTGHGRGHWKEFHNESWVPDVKSWMNRENITKIGALDLPLLMGLHLISAQPLTWEWR